MERVNGLTVADPLSDKARMGAVVSKEHMEKVLSYIELAKEEGGTLLTGGIGYNSMVAVKGTSSHLLFSKICRQTAAPTKKKYLVRGHPYPFDTEEEALAMANGTAYGLAATIWTSDLKTAHRMAAGLHAGIIWVNCWLLRDLRTPFGGVKQSGVGREGGFEALRFFTEPKNICIKL